jgi:DNA-3-methyladenine glycosylase I
VLQKRAAFRAAFADFAVDTVAAFDAADLARLLGDAGIVRNRLKIEAVIHNARRIQEMRVSHGSFYAWLEAHHPRSIEDWTKLFRQNFRFTGGLIVGEFLMSLGFLPGAHEPDCPAYAKIAALSPPWTRQ